MALTLTAAQISALAGDVPKPRQLVEINLGASVIRLSTGDDFTWDGDNYSKGGLKVSEVKTGKGGIQTCRVEVIDDNHAYSNLALTAGFEFKLVKYWTVYGEKPYAVDDPELKFQGEIVRIPRIGRTIVFDCATRYGTTRRIPNVTMGPPEIRHLPYPGQKIVIGNTEYEVEID